MHNLFAYAVAIVAILLIADHFKPAQSVNPIADINAAIIAASDN